MKYEGMKTVEGVFAIAQLCFINCHMAQIRMTAKLKSEGHSQRYLRMNKIFGQTSQQLQMYSDEAYGTELWLKENPLHI
ncbi:hypothetical protein ACJX0J_036932, partial [Zea mays]